MSVSNILFLSRKISVLSLGYRSFSSKIPDLLKDSPYFWRKRENERILSKINLKRLDHKLDQDPEKSSFTPWSDSLNRQLLKTWGDQEYKEASSLLLKNARRKKSELRQKKVDSIISELGMYQNVNAPEMMNRFARRAMRSKKAFNQMLDKVTRHAFNQLDPAL